MNCRAKDLIMKSPFTLPFAILYTLWAHGNTAQTVHDMVRHIERIFPGEVVHNHLLGVSICCWVMARRGLLCHPPGSLDDSLYVLTGHGIQILRWHTDDVRTIVDNFRVV